MLMDPIEEGELVQEARAMLDLAARLAWRGAGYVEPNPLVGCVIARADSAERGGERIIGVGHHRVYGGPHAEVDALENAAARGESVRGATVYVTLEPCNAQGKQPACVDALIEAGIGRVVCARRDPHPKGVGGAERLASAGIPVQFTDVSRDAIALSDPFIKRLETGMPWVIAKWAQSIDGRVATRSGESKWISCEASRRRVHRLRARVDAVLTGIGTVLSDDPALTARAGWLRRRVALRVVIDPELEIAEDALLVRTLDEAGLLVICSDEALTAQRGKVGILGAKGVEIVALGSQGEVRVDDVLRLLSDRYQVANVLVEAGPGLTGRLFDGGLVDEAHVYVAPMLMGDELAKGAARGRIIESLSQASRFELARVRRIENDVLLTYRRGSMVSMTSES